MLDVVTSDENTIAILDLLVQHEFDINTAQRGPKGQQNRPPRTILGELLTSIQHKPKIVEWLIAHNARLDGPAPVKSTSEKEQLLGQYFVRISKGIPEFHSIIDKYPEQFARWLK
jgi:hypothetical protein